MKKTKNEILADDIEAETGRKLNSVNF
jgi:hypothetical protein